MFRLFLIAVFEGQWYTKDSLTSSAVINGKIYYCNQICSKIYKFLQHILPFTADEVNLSKYISRISVLPTEDYKKQPKYDAVVIYVCRCDTYCKICW